MGDFAWQIEHWPTVDAFAAHLATHDPAICAWVQGLTIHHTAIPTVAQWAGQRSMEALGRVYRGKGWSGGPHLFIGPDGIWQGTPLDRPGIHAPGANDTRWGVEMVGDYTHAPWAEPIRSLAVGAMAALLRWRGLPVSPATVDGHRDYNKPSCPGDAIDLDQVRAALARSLAAPAAPITADSAILAAPRASAAQCSRFILARPHGAYTAYDIAQVMVPAYFATAAAVGLDPLVAIAQLVHETGNLTSWWAARPRRNPAGIGVTGQLGVGVSFPSWEADAIPAHVGRLLAYALPPRSATPAQAALMAKALGYRPLPAAYRGVAPTLRGLNGRWAVPGTNYADRLAAIANQIRGQ